VGRQRRFREWDFYKKVDKDRDLKVDQSGHSGFVTKLLPQSKGFEGMNLSLLAL